MKLFEGTSGTQKPRDRARPAGFLLSHRVGHRPNRVEPRAIKRRPKGHKLPTPRPSDEPGRAGRRAAGRSARTPPSSPQPAMMAMKAQGGEPIATVRLRSGWKSPLTLPRHSMPSLSRNITIRSFHTQLKLPPPRCDCILMARRRSQPPKNLGCITSQVMIDHPRK